MRVLCRSPRLVTGGAILRNQWYDGRRSNCLEVYRPQETHPATALQVAGTDLVAVGEH